MRFFALRSSVSTTAALLLSNGAAAFGSKSFTRTAFSKTASRHQQTFSSSSSSAMAADSSNNAASETLRVLILHGSGETADTFTETMEHWRLQAPPAVNLELTAIQASCIKGNGFSWWSMPEGVRSFTATEYQGFDKSASAVLEAMQAQDFDLVVSHSQGAILTSALLALGKIPKHPTKGYILNGVAWPNPYTKELEALRLQDAPRVLMIVGANDQMNPPEQAERVQSALEGAGCAVTVVPHEGGHSVPTEKDETLDKIFEWITTG